MNGKLMLASSPPLASVCARNKALLSSCGMSSMGKYCVSTADCSRGSNGARILRRFSHTTPLKNGCALISAAPPMCPSLSSASQISLWKVSHGLSTRLMTAARLLTIYKSARCPASTAGLPGSASDAASQRSCSTSRSFRWKCWRTGASR